jgi:predicted N-acetyltransferase YhbS
VTPTYIPGLQLAREFYATVVRSLLEEHFPQVPYAAALLGPGSEVAGFDSRRSTDHDWGPRLQVFLDDRDATQAGAVTAMLADRLPGSFRGYPVAFPVTPERGGTARHRVQVTGLDAWLTGQLGFDPRREVSVLDWLATPAQRLAEFTAGEVFHDGPGELTRVRARLAWYPRDVWLYLLACQWQRIGQEEAFPGRCAEAGDDLGSVIVTARLARDLMRLVLLMHQRYPPYSKWLGTAFAQLPGTAGLGASLAAAISAGDWRARQEHMCQAYETVAVWHNELGCTPPLDPRVRRFYERPYQVIGADRFTAALREAITDPQLRDLPLTGAVDQFTDSTDALGRLRSLRVCARAAIGDHHEPLLVRREAPGDASVIRGITAAAFGRDGEDPPEARLIDELRTSPAWLPELSLVAAAPAGEILGHVLCTRGYVGRSPVLALGPLAVRPDSQGRGVGSALVYAVLGAADALGEPLVALLGNPAFYGRFGFELSAVYQITPPRPEWQPHFQVRVLTGYEPSVRGMFSYPEPFDRVLRWPVSVGT